MRQLTASQKIAILENRVAQLEKQALFEGLKAKVAEGNKLEEKEKINKLMETVFFPFSEDVNFAKEIKYKGKDTQGKDIFQTYAFFNGKRLPVKVEVSGERGHSIFSQSAKLYIDRSEVYSNLLTFDPSLSYKELGLIEKFLTRKGLLEKDENNLPKQRGRAKGLRGKGKEEKINKFIKAVLSPFINVKEIGEITDKGNGKYQAYARLKNLSTYLIEVNVYKGGEASLKIDGDLIYYGRRSPVLLRGKWDSIRSSLRGLHLLETS